MFTLTLTERNYIVELIKEDKNKEQNLANKFYVDVDRLIQYIEGQSFVDTEIATEHEETEIAIDLCPNCKVYCIKRFVDGRCE